MPRVSYIIQKIVFKVLNKTVCALKPGNLLSVFACFSTAQMVSNICRTGEYDTFLIIYPVRGFVRNTALTQLVLLTSLVDH